MKEIEEIFAFYRLPFEDRKIFLDIIYPIIEHKEFQRRMDSNIFPHHDKVSLGNHIISDAVVSYIISKILNLSFEDIRLAVLISMFHDLYELPWQNAHIEKSLFCNKHGFTHPLEGIVNAYTWYPNYFNNEIEAEQIVDGVIHHMFPFPVRCIDMVDAELNNRDKFEEMAGDIKRMVIDSSNRFKIGHVSLCPSKFKIGRIMSDSDKIVSWFKDANYRGVISCLTGENPSLDNYSRRRIK